MDYDADLFALFSEQQFRIEGIRLSIAVDMFALRMRKTALAHKYRNYHDQIRAIAKVVRKQWLDALLDQIKRAPDQEVDILVSKTKWWLEVNQDLSVLVDQLQVYHDCHSLRIDQRDALNQLAGMERCMFVSPIEGMIYLYSMIVQPEWKVVGLQMCHTSSSSKYSRVYFLARIPHPSFLSGDVENNCQPVMCP